MTLVDIANIAVVLGGVSIVCGILWKVFSRYKETTNAINKAEKIDSIIDSVSNINIKMDNILVELQPNGGKSIKDTINRVEHNINFINIKLNDIETQMLYNKTIVKNLVNSKTSGYWISDNTGKTIEVSYTVCKMLNKPEDSLLGLNWMSYLHHEDKQRIEEAFKSSISLNKDFNEDYRILFNDNNFIKVNAYAKRIIIKDKFIGYYGVIKKIT